ncbi:SBBP repeat-containing protein, partial [Myxococcus sp. AM001]|nr:SBBP repeat-containing protein [Myxococcus sp. AM001]
PIPLWLLPALAACQPPASFDGPLTPAEHPVLVGGGGCLSPAWRILQFGSAGDDVAVDVGLDADCDLFVAGTTLGVLEEGSVTRGQFQDAFVASLDASAQPRWLRQYGSAWDDTVKGLAVSPEGDTYVVGSTPLAMPGAVNLGQGDAFVIKHGPGGALDWLVQRGSAEEDTGLGVALSRDGRHVFLAGGTMEKPDVSFDMSIEVLEAGDGTVLEARRHGTAGHDRAEAVAVSAEGSVVLAGATLGGFASANAGSFDAFLAHLDPTLGLTWARQPATPDIDAGLKVVIAPDGAILMLALSFSDLATGRGENDGLSSAFLLKYDPMGRLLWAQRVGSPHELHRASGLAVDGHGAIYVAGGTHGAMDGPNQGGRDAFVVKYDAHGARLWARQLGTPGMDEAHAVALTRAGDVVIAGYTTGQLGNAHAGGQDVFVARFNSRGQQ